MKNLTKTLLVVIVLGLSAGVAYAQGSDFGGGDDTSAIAPWDILKPSPTVRLKLDFRNATADSVLHTFSQASGIPIIKDPTLNTGISLQSPKPVSLDDAFEMLNAVLGLKGFQITQTGNFLEVVPKASSGRSGGFNLANFQAGGGGGGGRNPAVLHVYKINYANATTLATTINAVYAPTPGAPGAFGLFGPGNPGAPGGFARPGGPGGLTNVSAPGGGPGGGFAGRFGRGGGGGASTGVQTVKASADDYSNSLIVYAPQSQQDEIADIIKQIDVPTEAPMQSRVYKLQFAVASDVASEIQSVLSSTTSTGRGGSTNTGRPGGFGGGGGGGGPFGFFARLAGGGGQNQNGTAIADTRTNSVIVTAFESTLDGVDQIVKSLDKPVDFRSTTFVYVLKNARADVVANLLNESFGNRTTNGPVGGSLTNTGLTQPSVTSSSLGTTSSIGSGTPGGATTGGARAGGGGNSQNQSTTGLQNQNSSATSFDENGRVVNEESLYGQVLLVPNIDTNSIIVVAPPQDQPIVKGILEQMDEIPEQVMIDVVILEVTLDKTDQFGVEWSFLQNHVFGTQNGTANINQYFGMPLPPSSISGATGTNASSPTGFGYTLTSGQLQAVLTALSQGTKLDVLSTPSIFTTNNATSQVNISTSEPYVTSQTADTTTGTILYNYSYLDVGIVLTVTPRITSGGYVTMDITQTANDLQGYNTALNAPIVDQREAETTVSAQNGETVVLGGLIDHEVSTQVNKVPVLGDIPLIGNLFRSSSKTNDKTELLVFMTPHIVATPEDAGDVTKSQVSQLGKEATSMLGTVDPRFKTTITNKDSAGTPITGAGSDSTPSATAPAEQSGQPSATGPAAPTN